MSSARARVNRPPYHQLSSRIFCPRPIKHAVRLHVASSSNDEAGSGDSGDETPRMDDRKPEREFNDLDDVISGADSKTERTCA